MEQCELERKTENKIVFKLTLVCLHMTKSLVCLGAAIPEWKLEVWEKLNDVIKRPKLKLAMIQNTFAGLYLGKE